MSFIYPNFLWALLLLGIPIIIHLFNFRRYRTVYFTNVRFLKNIQEETATKNRLKHLLVLLTRLLAITFLVFAFAQPFIPSESAESKPTSRAVSIYIDNSFSMETMQDGKRLFDIAKEKATEIADAYKVDDAFQLLTNDFEAGHQHLVNKEAFLQMLAQVNISPEVKTTDEILKRQKDILNRADEEQRSIFVISDFQKNNTQITPDSSYQINLVPISSKNIRNLSIDSAWFISPVQLINQPSSLCVRVHNYGTEDITNATLNLKIQDQVKGLSTLQISAGAFIIDTLNFTVNESNWQRGELFIQDYPVTFDDIFYFTYKPVAQIPVLTINGNNANAYLTSLFSGTDVFAYTQQQANQLNVSELDGFNLVVLNEVKSISSGLSEMLVKAVNNGTSVVVIPALDMDENSINTFLSACNAGSFGELINTKRTVSKINSEHAIFSEVFEKIPQNITLPFANKSFIINTSGRSMSDGVMLFSDAIPFLASNNYGSGKVYLFSSPLQNTVTDFPVQGGIFVPVFFRIAVLSQPESPLFVTIGKDIWIKVHDVIAIGDKPLTVSGAAGEFIPGLRRSGNKVEINVGTNNKASGIFVINESTDKQEIALNYDRRESNLTFYSAKDLEELFNAPNVRIISNTSQNLATAVSQFNEGKALWKICIILALAFLALEVLLIRFLP
ncbi:MAG: BatA domain-containing protein [Chitinophagales bacterium]|nr:BatA domain-containing protein [Bacteroidota bacterium]MBP8754585.1 BatA domain-containing protein [Chitinophagales bacterium]MBP9190384.1 BatA domain-containing protein [Chitinophagales bacterium]